MSEKALVFRAFCANIKPRFGLMKCPTHNGPVMAAVQFFGDVYLRDFWIVRPISSFDVSKDSRTSFRIDSVDAHVQRLVNVRPVRWHTVVFCFPPHLILSHYCCA